MIPQTNGIPQCILDLIEFLPCENSTAPVGVHRLTDLPDISSEMLSNIATADAPEAKKVFESALRFVTNTLMPQLRTFATPYIAPLLDCTCLCKPPSSPSGFAFKHPTNEDGVTINFAAPNDAIKKVSRFQIMVDTVGTVNLFIKEGVKITPVSVYVDRANWWKDVTIDYQLEGENTTVDIYFEQTTAYKVGFYDCLKSSKTGCCGRSKIVKDTPVSKYANAQGRNVTGEQKQIAGIRPCVVVDCDPAKLFCKFADMIAPAVVLMVAQALIKTSASSNNVNVTTMQNGEDMYRRAGSYGKTAKIYLENTKKLMHDFASRNYSGCFRCANDQQSSGWVGH